VFAATVGLALFIWLPFFVYTFEVVNFVIEFGHW